MVEQDDSKLKILQLECIIASKDKEISLLREQLSEDQEDVIQQLKQENEALKMQQQQQPKHHTSHGQQHKGVQDHSAHANGMALSSSRGPVSKSGIVELNVSGTTMTTSISALQQVPGSKLSTMFDPNHMHNMPQDSHGRVFLPYEADAFSVLLSLLHASSVFGRASRAYTHLLRQHNVTPQPYLTDLIQHLGLQQLLEPHPSVQHYAAAGAQHAGHHHTGGQHGAHGIAAGSSGASNAAAAPAAAAAAAAVAAGRAVGEWPGVKSDSKGGRGNYPGSGSGGGSSAAADRAQGQGHGRPRRSSSPTGAAAATGGSSGGGSGGSARGEHRGRGHSHLAQHGTARDKQQQQEQQQAEPPQSEATAHAKAAAALASAAAAQSAALQALSGKGPGGGGAAQDSSSNSTSGMPADMVASAALKGLRQGVQPKSNRTSSSTDVLKD